MPDVHISMKLGKSMRKQHFEIQRQKIIAYNFGLRELAVPNVKVFQRVDIQLSSLRFRSLNGFWEPLYTEGPQKSEGSKNVHTPFHRHFL